MRPRLLLLTSALAGLAATGCAVLGPTALRSGRAAYNEAIISTNNEQLLAMIVRMRYGEPTGLLAVSSITASMQIQAVAGANFGIGSDSSFEGNLVPLSAGIAYEENPTISYTPVQGEKYLRQMLSPLPIDLTLLILGALGDSPQAMTLLIGSINGIQNPDFLATPSPEVDPRFARVVALLSELDRGHHVTWARGVGEHPAFELALVGEGMTYTQQVHELYELLGLGAPRDLAGVATLPVRVGIGGQDTGAIRLDIRTLYDLFRIAAATVEVPEEHLASGLAPQLPTLGAAGNAIRIQRSKYCPDAAMISVKHHGWWYSIDATDTPSKLTFEVLSTLMSLRFSEAVEGQKAAPVLTIPASR